MGLKKFNAKKEIKKLKRRSNKLKKVGVIGAIIGTIFIISSYALYSYTGSSVAFNSTINKRVKTTVTAVNGTVESLSGKILSEEIKTNPNFSASHSDKGLYVQEGDSTKSIDGKPTYYFRGNVTNNYVKFAGLTWRIVRINEDGTIRLIISNGGIGVFNYTNASNGNYNESFVKTKVDAWYNGLSEENKSQIAEGEFCNDISLQAVSRYSGNVNVTFECPNGIKLALKAGILTADEGIYAGAYYLNQANTYLTNNTYSWTMTQHNSEDNSMFILRSKSDTISTDIFPHIANTMNFNIRQVINLKADTQVTGEGTSNNPYEVVETGSLNTKEGDYKEEQTFKVYPKNEEYEYKSTTCTDNAKGSYDAKTNTLTISNQTNTNTVCEVSFGCKLKTGEKKTIFGKSYDVLASCNQDFSKGFPNGGTSSTDSSNKSGLYKTSDDQGDSYYFRGAVTNNYVSFGKGKTATNNTEHDLIWRIVRINGDGTIRLILNDFLPDDSNYNEYNRTSNINDRKYVGFTYDNTHQCTQAQPCEVTYSNNNFNNNTFGGQNSTIKNSLETWYKSNLNNVDSKIATGYFCNDSSYGNGEENQTNTFNYGSIIRLYENYSPSLKCPEPNNSSGQPRTYGGIYKTKIGLITADELAFSGQAILGKNQSNLTMTDKEKDLKILGNSYLATNASYLTRNTWYWSITPARGPINSGYDAEVWGTNKWYSSSTLIPGMLEFYNVKGGGGGINKTVVPVINLNSNVTASGEGTSSNPFVIK